MRGLAATWTVLLTAACAQPPSAQTGKEPQKVPRDWAESVMIGGITLDGEQEVSLRLARFPGRGTATLWSSVFVAGKGYRVSEGELGLGELTGKTPVEASELAFEVTGPSSLRIECRDRDTEHMTCVARAETRAHAAPHPPPGQGPFPVTIEAEFVAAHRGVNVRPGRLEVMGRTTATITTPEGKTRFEAPGKWHEQTGLRPRFASEFTYFHAHGDGVDLIGRTGAATWGFLWDGERPLSIEEFTIDPLGPPSRSFRIVLENGETVEGEATIEREGSVPIEGRRRPGSTVLVESSRGRMAGHLNDWQPDE